MFGVSSVESLGEAVLKSSPLWAAGGRPRGSFFLFFFMRVCLFVGWGEGRRFEHRLVRKVGEGDERYQAWQKEGLWSGLNALCFSLRTRYGSPVASSSRLRRGMEVVGWERGFFIFIEVCPFGVKPGASASVHKGIWRAWWKPPCYLARAQRGASHASLPTWETSREKQNERVFFYIP